MKFKTLFSGVLFVLLSAMVFAGGTKDAPVKKAGEKLNVVCTIGMVADAAINVGGDRVAVTSLMGAGVDPHLYTASAGDVRRLQDADLILYSGLHLEAQMGSVLHKMEHDRPVVAVSESIRKARLISDPSFGATYDPHVWFDVTMWMEVVDAVADALISVDPEGIATYEANLAAYQEKLTVLEAEVREKLAVIGSKQRVIVTAHDAFNYFGRAYNLDVRGLQGISTETEAGTKDVQDLADFIAENRIPAIFVESSVPRKNVEALQAAVKSRGFDVEIGGELFSDAMGEEGTEDGTYIGMIRHNVDTVAGALGRK